MTRLLLRALPAAALLWCSLPAHAQNSAALAATNKLSDGGFEAPTPSYWTPTGAGATWPTARVHSGTHSIALSGAGAASWTQSEVVRNWVDKIAANTAFGVRVWVYTEGVNTAPTTDAGKYQMVLTFRNAAGANILGQDVVLDMPQAAAGTNGWVQVSTASLGDITLPVDARSVTATVRKGATAVGTMWFDDFAFIKSDGNVLTSWHGANVDFSGSWYTYWPGFDGSVATPNWVVGKTTAQAHTGVASLRVERLGAPLAGEETVAISQRVAVTPGRPVLVSYWVKHDANTSPTTIGTGDNNLGITALWYSNLQSGAAGYNEITGADIRLNGEYNPQVIPLLPRNAANGWTQYSFVVNPVANAVAMELRLRYWQTFTGVSYWDDVFIGDAPDVVTQVPNLLSTAAQGFEGTAPSYWTPTGAGATWPTARVHSGTHSIALSGAGAASWTQSEVVRNWVDKIAANTAFAIRAWVYTEGVNTAPTTDAAKYQLVATFRNAAGANILGQDVVLDLPQAAASTNGWVQVSTATLGDITLPVDARSVTVTVRKGASAVGTVWLDDFAFIKTDGNVLTSWHGANVDLPGDWYTYWPGFDGSVATPNWVVGKTLAQAHSGVASMRVERLGAPLAGEEAVVITPRVAATPGQPMLVSYWVKHDNNASPTTIGTGDNNLGITALWYSNLQSGAAGYNEITGADIRLNGDYNSQVIPLLPRNASNGWTNYAFVLYPYAEAGNASRTATAMEVRLRYWQTFTGVSYWDDIALTNISGANLFAPVAGEEGPAPSGASGAADRWFRANQPNPFSDRTEIRFALPAAEAVTLEVYDLLGRRVSLLADSAPMQAGERTVAFERGALPSGTYLVVLRTDSHTEARQITVVR